MAILWFNRVHLLVSLVDEYINAPFSFRMTCHALAYVVITIPFPGPNNLYPEDLIPFTRYPLFLVIDSENSHAFKAGLSELNLGL
jgi:hypothetical protein